MGDVRRDLLTMRRLLITLLAGGIMAVLLVIAAPAQAHADPTGCLTPDQAQAALTQLQNGTIDPNTNVQAPNCGVTGSLAPNPGPVVAAAVDFVKDPLGYLAAAVMGAATFVLAQVAALANASTAPDLSLDFWKSAYAQAWAIGLVLFCFVLLWEFGNLVLRRITPAQFGATLTIWGPASLGAMLFGPMIAQVLIQGSTYLTDGLIRHMTGFGGSDSFDAITKSVENTAVWGGTLQGAAQAFLAVFFGLAMLIAAVLVFVSLCFQALIMYLSSAAFAVAAAWLASTHTRKHTFSYMRAFVTACFAKVIVIFTLGVVLAMATAATAITGDGASKDFALIVMAIIGMLLAAFMPMILGKHTPVMPGMATPAGIGMGIAGSAVGWTAGSAAAHAAGRRLRTGGSKLAGVTSRKGPAPPPPGSDGGAGGGNRTIDLPVPAPGRFGQKGTGKVGKRTTDDIARDAALTGSGGGRRGSGDAARAAAATARTPDHVRTIDPPVPPAGGAANGAVKRNQTGQQSAASASKQIDGAAPRQDKPPAGYSSFRAAPEAQQSKLNQATRKLNTPPPTGDAT